MAAVKTLASVWPKSHAKVHLCLEDRKTGSLNWVLKDFSDSQAGQDILEKLAYSRVTASVNAGPTMRYIYLDESNAVLCMTNPVDTGKQLSLF